MEENKKNEIKNNDSLIKLLCYLGIFVLLMFIICPPLFRVLFPEEEENVVEKKEFIMNLNCVKIEDFVEYELKTTIDTIYVDNEISNSTFTYEIKFIDQLFSNDEIIIEEYEKLKRINNIDFNETDNKYVLNINYDAFDYSNEELLLQHQRKIAEQLAYYTNDHFECKTTKIQ